MDLRLRERAALVTGASKGIGKAIARGLAEEGVNVALLARNRDPLEQAATEIEAATGVRAFAVTADIRDTGEVASAVERVHAEFGTVHILVNNAGGPIKRPERQITWPPSDWLDDVDTKITIAGEFWPVAGRNAKRSPMPWFFWHRIARSTLTVRNSLSTAATR